MGCSVTRIKSLCSSATGQIPATPLRTPTVLFFPFYQSTCRISSLSSFLSLIYFFLFSLTALLGQFVQSFLHSFRQTTIARVIPPSSHLFTLSTSFSLSPRDLYPLYSTRFIFTSIYAYPTCEILYLACWVLYVWFKKSQGQLHNQQQPRLPTTMSFIRHLQQQQLILHPPRLLCQMPVVFHPCSMAIPHLHTRNDLTTYRRRRRQQPRLMILAISITA